MTECDSKIKLFINKHTDYIIDYFKDNNSGKIQFNFLDPRTGQYKIDWARYTTSSKFTNIEKLLTELFIDDGIKSTDIKEISFYNVEPNIFETPRIDPLLIIEGYTGNQSFICDRNYKSDGQLDSSFTCVCDVASLYTNGMQPAPNRSEKIIDLNDIGVELVQF